MKPRMNQRYLCGGSAVASLLLWCATANAQAPSGQWDFDTGNLNATAGGAPLAFADGSGGVTESGTSFGTTTSFGLPNINGAVASVMRFSANTNNGGYHMPVPSSSNGGGSLVNEWTLIMDVLYPAGSMGSVRPLADVDGSQISAEPEVVITAANGIGVPGGASFGVLASNTWYRIGIVANATNITFYTNGAPVGSVGSGGLDGRFALNPGSVAVLFGTPGNAAAPGFVNSVQIRPAALTRGQMMALGGPAATGIPQTIPPVPSFIEKWTPAGALASTTTPLSVIINKGDSTINNGTITLKLDGAAVPNPTITTSGDTITVSKTGLPALPVNSTHTLELTYTDSQAGLKTFTRQFKAVLLFEDFDGLPLVDAVEEANGMKNAWTPMPPPGWVTNHSQMPGYGDRENDGRTEWAGWTFATKEFWLASDMQTREQFNKAQGVLAIADPDEWDDGTHPRTDEQGNNLYFNSFLSTPTLHFTGIPASLLYIKFDSSWRPEGFDDWGSTNNQTAKVTVSYNGAQPVTVLHWDSQEGGPFFHPDSQNETVFLQLTNAPAGASNIVVQFGLTLGANDWWWAVDNVEINAGVIAPAITAQPQAALSSPGADVIFNVAATGTEPLAFQWLFNGAAIANATNLSYTLANATTNSAGEYRVVVTNSAGAVTSSVARLTVYAGPLTNALVTHLKFDGNFADASGRGNNGTGMNSPAFEQGRLGQAVRVNSSTTLDPNQYVSLGYPADLKFGSGETASDFSFAFWTRVATNAGDKPFIANKDWNSGNNRGVVVASRTAGVSWNMRDDQSARRDGGTVGPQLADRTNWHHIVVTFDRRGQARTYVDGQLAGSGSIAPDAGKLPGNLDTDDLSLTWNIGQDGTGNYTDGGSAGLDALIDDFGVWRRVLTAQEALAIYTAGLANKDLATAVVPPGKIAPTILAAPVGSTVEEGLVASFSVSASGTEPFTYQWFRNGAPVTGATGNSLTITNVQSTQAGSYTVVVANSAGSVTSAPVALTVTAAQPVQVTGQWDFNEGDLRATIGQSLTNFDATVAADTQFGTTAALGIANIGGTPAKVLAYSPSTAAWGGYIMPHGAAPNGGGSFVNRYTIVWDVYYPAASNNKWRSLLQTAPNNSGDGDFFINAGNAIGISSAYHGTVPADAWTRIVAVFDLPYRTLKKYINGTLVNVQTLGTGVDGRWSLAPTALLFADEDGETAAGYVNAIQFRNGIMTDAEVAALGGVTTDGIPGMRPKIASIVREGNSLRISWSGAPGLKLQQSSSLAAQGWTDVPGSAGASTVTVPLTGNAGFFRLAQ